MTSTEGLTGQHNARLYTTSATAKEETAPLMDNEKMRKEINASIPSKEDVLQAKNWVDNGSRL